MANELNKEKLKGLIHEIAHATRDLPGFGRTKLYKVMWFFEAREYALNGRVFSGARYIRDQHGPRLHNYDKWFSELENEGLIRRVDEPYYNRKIKRVQSIQAPRGGLLSAEQARTLQYWINKVSGMTAGEISEESHDYGWEIISQGDEIPLAAILAERVRKPNAKELEWARGRAKELGRL